MSQREQAEIVASWLYELPRATQVVKSSIAPVTVNLSYKDVSFSLYGCSYKETEGRETLYLIGKEPFEQVLQMTGSEDSGDFCFYFDKEYHVAGYIPKETYDAFDPELVGQYHPFGPNMILGEADDDWPKSERKVIEMDITYYPRLGSG